MSGDLDGDGDQDMVVSNGGVRVIWNQGRGRFAPSASHLLRSVYSVFVAIGDVDADGDMDIVSSGKENQVHLISNLGGGSFGTPVVISTLTDPRSVALGDFDGDADLDIVVADVQGASVWILFNDAGTFSRAVSFSGGLSYDVTVVDVEPDGDLDVACAIVLGTGPLVLVNQGNGVFVSTAIPLGPTTSIAAGDTNGDDLPDLVLGSYLRALFVLTRNVDGSYGARALTGDRADAVSLNDVDGDRAPDIVSSDVSTGRIQIFKGDGFGGFATPHYVAARSSSAGHVLADVDGDRDADIVVVEDYLLSTIFNMGGGGYRSAEPYTTLGFLYLSDTALGDLDGDSDLDILISNEGGTGGLGFYRNINGDGVFEPMISIPSGPPTTSIAIGDLDGDSDLDVAVTNILDPTSMAIGTLSVLLNDGSASFALPLSYPSGFHSRDIALGDVDGDSDLDVVVANEDANESIALFLNAGNASFQGPFFFPVGTVPRHVLLEDLNGDGWPDVIVSNGLPTSRLSVLINRDGMGLHPATIYHGRGPIAAGDIDADGDIDITFGSPSDVGSLINAGGGVFFSGPTLTHGGLGANGIVLAELDRRPGLDIAVSLYRPSFRANEGLLVLDDFPLSAAAAQWTYGAERPGAIAVGDLDSDSDLDVVATTEAGNIVILRNTVLAP